MRQAFTAVDDALIERVFQPLSNSVSHTLGLNRLHAASFCIEISAAAWVVSQSSELSDAVLQWQALTALPRVLLLFLGLTALLGLRQLFRRVPTDSANPLRRSMQPHRGLVLLLLLVRTSGAGVMSLSDASDIAMLGFMAMAMYLSACAPPPPVRRDFAVPQPA